MSHKKMTKPDFSMPTDDQILPLNPMEHIRLRPGMYLGSVDTRGLNRLVDEMLEHIISQARQCTCTVVTLSLLGPQTLQIRDDGPGLPLYKTEQGGHSLLGLVMTSVKAGGPSSYMMEGQSSGKVRLALVTAFCRDVFVEVKQDGALWSQHYQRGRKASELTQVRDLDFNEDSGTWLTFAIDDEIFHDAAFDSDWIEGRLFDLAHLLPGLTIAFENHMTGHRATFRFPTGFKHALAHMNRHQKTLAPILSSHMMVRPAPMVYPFELEAALQFLSTPTPFIGSFTNGIKTPEQGMPVNACLDALRDALMEHSTVFQREDMSYILQHVTLVVSVWHPLTNDQGIAGGSSTRDVYSRLYNEFSRALDGYFNENPDCIPQLERITLRHRRSDLQIAL